MAGMSCFAHVAIRFSGREAPSRKLNAERAWSSMYGMGVDHEFLSAAPRAGRPRNRRQGAGATRPSNQKLLPQTTAAGFDPDKCDKSRGHREFSKPRPIPPASSERRSTNYRNSTTVPIRRAHGEAGATAGQNVVSLRQVPRRFRGPDEKPAKRRWEQPMAGNSMARECWRNAER